MDLVVLSGTPATGEQLLSCSRVIKAAHRHTVVAAADLLTEMTERAAQQKARDQKAFDDARARGLIAGRAKARAELAEKLAAAEVARHQLLRSLTPTLVDLVMDAVATVLHSADKQLLVSSAMTAVQDLIRQAQWARLRVPPQSVSSAQAALKSLGAQWQITTVVADPRLTENDCIFETDVGIADASLSTQLEALRAAVQAALQATEAALPTLESMHSRAETTAQSSAFAQFPAADAAPVMHHLQGSTPRLENDPYE